MNETNETNQNIEPYGLIYKTINSINSKIYIGLTTKIKDHFSDKYKGSGSYFSKSIKKYGKENFKSELICYASNQEELNSLETFLYKRI